MIYKLKGAVSKKTYTNGFKSGGNILGLSASRTGYYSDTSIKNIDILPDWQYKADTADLA